jgi:hypothetical protein
MGEPHPRTVRRRRPAAIERAALRLRRDDRQKGESARMTFSPRCWRTGHRARKKPLGASNPFVAASTSDSQDLRQGCSMAENGENGVSQVRGEPSISQNAFIDDLEGRRPAAIERAAARKKPLGASNPFVAGLASDSQSIADGCTMSDKWRKWVSRDGQNEAALGRVRPSAGSRTSVCHGRFSCASVREASTL